MDLLAAALACARNAAVRAVVFTGAGRNFCFGGDLRAMAARETTGDDYIRELTDLPALGDRALRAHGRPGDRRRQRYRRGRWRGPGRHGRHRPVRARAPSSTSPIPERVSHPTRALRSCCRAPSAPGAPWSCCCSIAPWRRPTPSSWGLVNEVLEESSCCHASHELAEQLAAGATGALRRHQAPGRGRARGLRVADDQGERDDRRPRGGCGGGRGHHGLPGEAQAALPGKGPR